ncbi:MAG: transglutaminase-like domain-containing protein [Lachnospiraceae bacterium]|nr:transglutaminase-like domain-containing protein [Lachnospiraceae bacterium]
MSEFFSAVKNTCRKIFKREEYLAQRAGQISGIYVVNKTAKFSGTDKLRHALTNAVLMFSIVTGLTVFLASSFKLQYNFTFTIGIYVILATLLSLMNVRKMWQNIGYVIVFIAFTFILITFRQYINSGLNGYLNDFYKFLSDYWEMDFQKTYNEQFEEQHVATVTAFLVTMGFAIMVLLNFVFNNEQSPLTVFVTIAPILFMVMYFDAVPSYVVIFLMMFTIVTCFLYRHSFQFSMPVGKKDIRRIHIRHGNYYVHYSNGTVIAQIGAVSGAFLALVTVFMAVLYPSSKYRQNEVLVSAKESTTETVKQVLLYGLRSLWDGDGDDAIGGLNSGSLGQNGTVYSDYETDLIVTFAPYVYDTVYLKSFVGTNYYSTRWTTSFTDASLVDSCDEFDNAGDLFNYEADHLEELMETDSSILKGKLRVEIADPIISPYTVICPYHTQADFGGGHFFTGYFGSNDDSVMLWTRMPFYEGAEDYKEYTYYVYQDIWDSEYVEAPVKTEYDKFVYDNYLSIWGVDSGSAMVVMDSNNELDVNNVRQMLKSYCEDRGFGGSKKEIIAQIQDMFVREFKYSLNPGVTPKSEDFVLYFLKKQKEGYCSYFATSAVLLLRTMGIPARYAEGYVVSMSDVVDADILTDEKYEDYLQGEANVGKTAVVRAEIDDSRAHAWVEVYLNGYGWVPVEFTPPSGPDDDSTNYDNLWRSLTNFDGSDNTANVVAAFMNSGAGNVIAVIIRIIVAAAIAFGLVILYRFYKNYRDKKAGIVHFYSGDNERVLKLYQGMCAYLKAKKLTDDDNITITEFVNIINQGEGGEGALEEFARTYKKAAYSSEKISREELLSFKANLRAIKSALRKRAAKQR